MKALLATGAKVNEQHWDGGTALTWAALFGHASVVEALLKAGANPDLQVDNDPSPLPPSQPRWCEFLK